MAWCVIIMAKNKYSCPICSFSVNHSQWFYSCSVCKTLSLFPRIGLPVNKEQASKNFTDIIQRRQEAVTSLEVCRPTEPELEIAVKTVFNEDIIDGFIITIDDCLFIHYLQETA